MRLTVSSNLKKHKDAWISRVTFGLESDDYMDKIDVYKLETRDLAMTDAYTSYMSDVRLEQMRNTTHPKRMKQHMFTELLVYYALNQYQRLDKLVLTYDKFGKPVYDNLYTVSISHTKDIIAIAVSKHPVGIDIQYMESKFLRLASKILSTDELKIFDEQDDKVLCFFKYWTAKESFSKFLGTGMTYSMKEMVFSNKCIKYGNINANISHYVDENINMSVAYGKKEMTISMHKVDFLQITEILKRKKP